MKRFFLIILFINFKIWLFGNIKEIFLLPTSVEEISLMTSLDALSEDNNSVFYNSAGIAMNNVKKISLNYSLLFDDIKSGSFIFLSPFKKNCYSIGIKYYYLGVVDFYDTTGLNTGSKYLFSHKIVFGFGREMFIPGLYLGISLGTGIVSLKKDYQDFLSKFGVIYILPLNATELHLGFNTSLNYNLSYISLSPSLGIKYFIPEYNTFFLVSYKNFYGIKIFTTGLEINFIRNVNISLGYEFVEQKSNFLGNLGLGVKFDFIKRHNFELSFGFKNSGVLGQFFSTGLGIRL